MNKILIKIFLFSKSEYSEEKEITPNLLINLPDIFPNPLDTLLSCAQL